MALDQRTTLRYCKLHSLKWLGVVIHHAGMHFTYSHYVSLKAKFHYAIWFEAGSKLVADLQRAELKFGLSSSLLAANLHELVGPRPASNLSATSFEPALNQLRTSFEPASVMEFGFYC